MECHLIHAGKSLLKSSPSFDNIIQAGVALYTREFLRIWLLYTLEVVRAIEVNVQTIEL